MRRAQLLLLFVACAFADPAAAEYPDHPIRMIVPQAAGSSTDTVTRESEEPGIHTRMSTIMDSGLVAELVIGPATRAGPVGGNPE